MAVDFELIEQLRKSAGKFVSVNPTLSVLRDAGGNLKLRTQSAAVFNAKEIVVDLLRGAGEVFFDGLKLNWRFGSGKNFKLPHRKIGREFFDADKIGNEIILRHWRAGDRFQPIGLKTSAKLQDLFVNAKIPRERRQNLTLASTAAGEIFWVEGLRISGNFKITPKTKCHLVLRWRRL
jgi:tRNA(Ile)-lysidine synthase